MNLIIDRVALAVCAATMSPTPKREWKCMAAPRLYFTKNNDALWTVFALCLELKVLAEMGDRGATKEMCVAANRLITDAARSAP